MGLLIWGWHPAGLRAGRCWLILRRPLRQFVEDVHVDHARELFRQQREWLEARFSRPWARPTPSRACAGRRPTGTTRSSGPATARPAASSPWSASTSSPARSTTAARCPRHATALFEFRKGRWHAEGKRLDEIRPDEAVGRNQRFEPVVTPSPPRSDPPPASSLDPDRSLADLRLHRRPAA